MSWQHFGFFAGFLFVGLWAVSGIGPAIGALIVGAVGFFAGRVLDGNVNVAELVDRFAATTKSPTR